MKLFKCPKCGRFMFVTRWQEIFSMHLFGKLVYRKCKGCGERHWLRKVDCNTKETEE